METSSQSDERPWQFRAACRGIDPELFFPKSSSREDKARTEQALDYCARCEVRDDCLDYALRYEEFGTWGGKTEEDRGRILLERKREASKRVHPTAQAMDETEPNTERL